MGALDVCISSGSRAGVNGMFGDCQETVSDKGAGW